MPVNISNLTHENKMALKKEAARILNFMFDVLDTLNQGLKVLVVDHLGMQIISRFRRDDIASDSIAVVRQIEDRWPPLLQMDAIYLIRPSEESVCAMLSDFETETHRMYRSAYVVCTERCPNELKLRVLNFRNRRLIKCFGSINLAFVPYESRVFSLEASRTLYHFYNPLNPAERRAYFDRIANQIATLCAALHVYPTVRYRSNFHRNAKLARVILRKLDNIAASNVDKVSELPKESCLLILDRSMDCVSPLLHACTYQALAHDVLNMKYDKYSTESGTSLDLMTREIYLDESDSLWAEWRHHAITTAWQHFKQSTEQLISCSLLDSDMIRHYALHTQLAADCMVKYRDTVVTLSRVERELLTETDVEGGDIQDKMSVILPILQDPKFRVQDKIRIILLYILTERGISDETLCKLMKLAEIPSSEKSIFANLMYLRQNTEKRIYRPPHYRHTKAIKSKSLLPQLHLDPYLDVLQIREERHRGYQDNTTKMTWWTPVVKHVIQDFIEIGLDTKLFPPSRNPNNTPTVPRLIVYMVGGITHSEMRCVYEVSQKVPNWDIIVGSDHILTPEDFLNDLRDISRL